MASPDAAEPVTPVAPLATPRANPITKRRLPRLNLPGVGLVITSPWGQWVWTCPDCEAKGFGHTRKIAKDGLHRHSKEHTPGLDATSGDVAQAAEHSASRTDACTSAGHPTTDAGFDSLRGLNDRTHS